MAYVSFLARIAQKLSNIKYLYMLTKYHAGASFSFIKHVEDVFGLFSCEYLVRRTGLK